MPHLLEVHALTVSLTILDLVLMQFFSTEDDFDLDDFSPDFDNSSFDFDDSEERLGKNGISLGLKSEITR